MVTAGPVGEALKQAIGAGGMVAEDDLSGYAVDGVVPKAAVFPKNEEQLVAVLSVAARERWTVVPRGSGGLMGLGNAPERIDIVVGLEGLERSIEHAPEDLKVTVGAGMTLGGLLETLAKEGQWLPLDPPLASRRTVGGVLATGLDGPLSLGYGTARDMVLGMRVAGADGVVTKSGGRVVKNVTGFDVAKVHIGGVGTLGIIVEASFRLQPLPRKDATLTARFDSLERAMEAARGMAGPPYTPQALEVVAEEGVRLCARFLGSASGVERRLKESRIHLEKSGAGEVEMLEGNEAGELWQRLSDFGWEGKPERGLVLRLGCLPSRVGEVAAEIFTLAQRQRYGIGMAMGPGRGVLRCVFPGLDWDDDMVVSSVVDGSRGVVESVGGYAVVERCPTQAKKRLDVWGDAGPGLAVMHRLKEQMDPTRLLNPGRFVGGI